MATEQTLIRELFVLVNPVAGAGRTARRWPGIAAELQRLGFRVRAHFSEAPGAATEKVKEWLRSGVRRVVAVGGDGTVNEVANGFLSSGTPLVTEAVLSVIPSGTGHDFARSVGIHSLQDAFAALSHGRVCSIDACQAAFAQDGRQASRYFVNAADVGLGAAAAAAVNRSRKLLGGLWTYVAGAVRALWSFRCANAVVEVDGTPVTNGPTEMVLIANGRFHAGGMRMAPMADPSDGLLEVLVLREVSRLHLLMSLLPRVFHGRHLGHPAVTHARGKRVLVRSAEPLPFEMDGEQPGTTDVAVEVVPAALRVTTLP
ncbi:MAG: diacylglycerol kinase family lipid kinase [Candidatus Binatia bacterium]|nr:diacylglycerol kinase family lipid kinase [Candidatus Binatia bacterium]